MNLVKKTKLLRSWQNIIQYLIKNLFKFFLAIENNFYSFSFVNKLMIKLKTINLVLKLSIQIKVLIVKRKEVRQGKEIIQSDFSQRKLNFYSEIFSISEISIEIINHILILLNFPIFSCNYNLNNRKKFLLNTLFIPFKIIPIRNWLVLVITLNSYYLF